MRLLFVPKRCQTMMWCLRSTVLIVLASTMRTIEYCDVTYFWRKTNHKISLRPKHPMDWESRHSEQRHKSREWRSCLDVLAQHSHESCQKSCLRVSQVSGSLSHPVTWLGRSSARLKLLVEELSWQRAELREFRSCRVVKTWKWHGFGKQAAWRFLSCHLKKTCKWGETAFLWMALGDREASHWPSML